MKTKFFSTIIACFIVATVFSQSNLNKYKYVIVPQKFDFLKKEDQYQLNSLAQFLFNKYGFEALEEGDTYPEDLIRNRCLALRSDVLKDSGMFKTKLTIELKNCNDQIVYTSEVGESREKDYNKSYTEALRNAFKSIKALNYKYKPSDDITALSTQSTDVKNEVTQEIEQLKEEIQNLKKEKEAAIVNTPKVVAPLQPKAETAVVVVPSIKNDTMEADIEKMLSEVLYAQEIENGFQLVDSSPKVVYRIKETRLDTVFLVENMSAIVYKKREGWVIEYYSNNKLKQETLNIKF